MTPRYARLGGWLLLTGIVGMVFACSTPTIDGTDLDNASQGASSGKRTGKSKRAPEKEQETDDDDDTSETNTNSKPKTPTTDTTAVPTTSETTEPPPPPTTTATTPPPVTQPNCASDDPVACLDCCLDANPDAVSYENNFDACLNRCDDQACFDTCQAQHISACNGSAACTANHTCMEANNCLSQNFCAP